jgi:enoyl-CoA hydratase
MVHPGKVLSRKEDGVGHIVFDNQERHNAVSLEMWDAASACLKEFEHDGHIRVVIVSGAGAKAFISGADISKFENERSSEEAVDRYNRAVDAAYAAFAKFPKPTIAMIRGYCIGGGVGLALSCDLRICTEGSKFAIPAAKLGLGYRYAGVKRLTELVGPASAKEIFFTARQFTAGEAASFGLVNRVVADEEIEVHVKGIAETIAGNAPLVVDSIKFMVAQAIADESVRDLEKCDEMVRAAFASADYKEGRKAFMEKRKPKFFGA